MAAPRPAEAGGVLAETAFTLPLMLLCLFGMVYFGMLLYTHILVQLAAAQGARVGASAYTDDPTGARGLTPTDRARGYAEVVIASGLDRRDLEAVEVTHETVAGEDAIRVTVAYRFRLLVPFMADWGASEAAQTGGLRVVHSGVYRVE